MNNNKARVTLERAAVETAVIIKLGLDVHAQQIVVCRQNDGEEPKPALAKSWPKLIAWVQELSASGAQVHSCYEAGPCGYGLHRQLEALGVQNVVVVPQRWDEQNQRVKTDRRDARELCDRLDRYLRGKAAFMYHPSVSNLVSDPWRALSSGLRTAGNRKCWRALIKVASA